MMHELLPGDPQLIGPYRLRGRLGAGGMGQVYLGLSPGGRPVAVKVVRDHLATDPEFRERFRREITVARKVSGIHTAPVVDADVDGPVPWLATAYVRGPSLADAVSQYGALPAESVLALVKGLAEGLAAIHAADVVHRDLKPANVLLAPDGPRIIDFGISRAAEATALTHTGLVVGSPGFMSPEQAEGRPVGPPSDVFSLGAVLAFAATGQGPFGTGSTPALVYRVVYSPPDLAQIPAVVRPLIERCLAKDPAQRPGAAQLLAELEAACSATNRVPEPVTQTSIQPPAAGATVTRLEPAAAGLAGPGQPVRRRRIAWRPLAVASISVGLLAGCTYTGVALTSSSGHASGQPTVSPTASTPAPTASASSSAPATATPSTSPTAIVIQSAPPTVTASPSASVTPAVTASPSASPSVQVTMTAAASTPTPASTVSAPVTPAPVTTTAAP